MGLWPVQWMGYWPVFRFLHFVPYFSGAFGFAILGLAACGVEALVTNGGSRRQIVLTSLAAASVVGLIPLFVSTVGFNQSPAPATIEAASLYIRELARVLLVVGGVVAVVWLRTRRQLNPAATGILIIALVCVELGPIAFHRRLTRNDVWNADVPAYVRFLKI